MLAHIELQRPLPELHDGRTERGTGNRTHPESVNLAKRAINDGGGMGFGLQRSEPIANGFSSTAANLIFR